MRSNRVEPTQNPKVAQVAQLGERQTEDLNVPGSNPGLGIILVRFHLQFSMPKMASSTYIRPNHMV